MSAAGGGIVDLWRRWSDARPSIEHAFLPAALEVTETPASPTGRAVGITIIAFAVLALGWALVGKVDITATATGSIMPAGMVKVVQAPDIGIVRAIRVEDGTHVKRGDILIELDPTPNAADQTKLTRDLMQADLDFARLRALAEGVQHGSGPGAFVPPAEATAEASAQAAAGMRAQAAEQAAKIADLDSQIREKDSEVAEIAATTTQLRAVLPILEEKHKIRNTLQQQGFGSTFALLDAEEQLTQSRQQLAVLAQRAGQARAARAALIGQRAAAASGYASKVLTDLAAANQRRNELAQDLVKAQRKLVQTILRAPTDGVVEQLAVHTQGAVVTPAQRLLTVVPNDRRLMVQAALPNRDIGFVHAGQPVAVKVEAFNFTTYGVMNGHVVEVSRDAVARADQPTGEANPTLATGNPARGTSAAYVVRIALDQQSMDIDGRSQVFVPGMAVTAEIRTGRRTIMSYLMSPIVRRVSESMQER